MSSTFHEIEKIGYHQPGETVGVCVNSENEYRIYDGPLQSYVFK